eukprot:GHRR01025111.1.p1 GENE.GHRR01025111.1~~GHRR01025111.1.p1  ORF type:complete len:173 (+),score=64.21 GHRR01025111.1:773-1291(+)
MLQHSHQLLGNVDAYGEERMTLVLPNYLSMLHRLACEQPGLIPQVLMVLQAVLKAIGSTKMDLSRRVLAFLVSMLLSGAVDLVMNMAMAWSTSADPSLVRHFIQLVLESVEPPYSAFFARSMLAIMHTGLLARMRPTHGTLLREFAVGCQAVAFLPPLSNKDLDLLEELAKY